MAIATLGLILFVICININILLFGWSFGLALFRAILMANGCLLILLFVTYLWPKLMWSGVWLRWLRRSWWWERKLKPKKYQLVWWGAYWRRGFRWLGPYPNRPMGDNCRGCIYRWRFAVGPLEIRRWERKLK